MEFLHRAFSHAGGSQTLTTLTTLTLTKGYKVNQPSLFDDPVDPGGDDRRDDRPREPVIEGVAEVYDLARQVMGVPESEDAPPLVKARRRASRAQEARAARAGLVAQWAPYDVAKGYIRITDPTTGDEHDVAFSEAPGWAKREAIKRAELWRAGDRHAFELNREQMERIFERDRERDELVELDERVVDDLGA